MRGQPFTFSKFNGGLNVADSIYELAPNESRDCRNVIATPRGAIRKRDGSVVLAKPVVALDSLYPLTAVGPYLIGQGGAALYAIDPTGTITTITGTSGATSGKRWSWVQSAAQGGQGPLYGVDGAVAAQWTGAGAAAPWTASAGTLPVGAKYVVQNGNRVFLAGMAAYTPSGGSALSDAKSAVVFGQPGDPRNFPAKNVVLFDPGDGEEITGLGTVGPYVLVFKPSKVWVIYDLDTGANRRISVGTGCVAHRSIVESPLGTLFLSKDQGVMSTDGNGVKRISDNVLPLLQTISAGQRQNAAGVFFNGHYYLSIPVSGSTNDLTFDFQMDIGAWWVHTLASQQWAAWDTGNGPKLYAAPGVAVGGQFVVEQAFVAGQVLDSVGYSGTDGVSIDAYWKSPFHVFGVPFLRKRLRRVRFDGRGEMDVLIAKEFANFEEFSNTRFNASPTAGNWADPSGSWGVEDGEVWGGQILVGRGEVLTPGVAHAWSVVFRNPRSTTFEVDSYTMAITPRKD